MNKFSRISLVVIIWAATVAVAVFWFSTTQLRHLTIGAGPKESETFAFANAITGVINKNPRYQDIQLFETGGSHENLQLLLSGQIDLATIQGDITVPDNVVAIARLYPDAYHLIVNNGQGIKSFYDLRGRRIAIPPKSSGQHQSFWFLADHFGLERDSFTGLPMSEEAANFAMEHGQVDAIFRVRSPGNPIISDLVKDFDMHIVPIDQAPALRLRKPALDAGEIPAGSYRGYPPLPAEKLSTVVLDRLLVTRADLPEDMVYRFTQDIFENRSDLLELSPLAGFMEAMPENSSSVIPTHPGARRYFDREKPGFLQQNVRVASASLYTVAILITGLFALRSHWQRMRRVRMVQFNKQLMDIAGEVRADTERASLLALKNQLMDILHEVIVDLDKDKVSQAEFEHFSFAWQAVDALVRDQLSLTEQGGTVS